MLERKIVRRAVVAQEIRRLRRREVRHEVARGSDDRGQKLVIEASADHRSHLEDLAILDGEAADAGGQQQLDARRQHRRRLAEVEFQRSVADPEHVVLDEETRDLLGEQGVAIRFLGHDPSQRLGHGVNPEPRLHEALDVFGRQRIEPQRRHAAAAAPGRLVFRPARVEDQKAEASVVDGNVTQDLFGRAIDPVNVLDQ